MLGTAKDAKSAKGIRFNNGEVFFAFNLVYLCDLCG